MDRFSGIYQVLKCNVQEFSFFFNWHFYWDNLRFTRSIRNNTARCQFPNGNILQYCSTISQLGHWEWYNPDFPNSTCTYLCMCWCVCMCLLLCSRKFSFAWAFFWEEALSFHYILSSIIDAIRGSIHTPNLYSFLFQQPHLISTAHKAGVEMHVGERWWENRENPKGQETQSTELMLQQGDADSLTGEQIIY